MQNVIPITTNAFYVKQAIYYKTLIVFHHALKDIINLGLIAYVNNFYEKFSACDTNCYICNNTLACITCNGVYLL